MYREWYFGNDEAKPFIKCSIIFAHVGIPLFGLIGFFAGAIGGAIAMIFIEPLLIPFAFFIGAFVGGVIGGFVGLGFAIGVSAAVGGIICGVALFVDAIDKMGATLIAGFQFIKKHLPFSTHNSPIVSQSKSLPKCQEMQKLVQNKVQTKLESAVYPSPINSQFLDYQRRSSTLKVENDNNSSAEAISDVKNLEL